MPNIRGVWRRSLRSEEPERAVEASGGTTHGSASRAKSTRHGKSPSGGSEMLIEKVLHRDNLLEAHRRVVHNRGAPGVDGMTVDELMPYCRQHWSSHREEILSGRYIPQPVRKVLIPKSGGGKRMLGIPTVLDRLIQQALAQVLTPIFDPTFFDRELRLPAEAQHPRCGAACSRSHRIGPPMGGRSGFGEILRPGPP